MLNWIKKHKILFAIICVFVLLALIGVPFLINIFFKMNIDAEVFQAEWSAGDVLGYYGAVLSFIGTVVLGALALYQNHIIKEEAKKQADLLEERTRIENMPKFIMCEIGASGFCGHLSIRIKNISKNIAFEIRIYNIRMQNGDKILWESTKNFQVAVLNGDDKYNIKLDSPSFSDRNLVKLTAMLSCKDKYDEDHEYLMTLYCVAPNIYVYDSTEEVKKK